MLHEQHSTSPRLFTDEEMGVSSGPPRLFTDEEMGLTSSTAPIPSPTQQPGADAQGRGPYLTPRRYVDQYGVTTALAVGAPVAGAAIGAPLGPAGMIGGGALGAAAGQGMANIARDLEDKFRFDIPQQRTLGQQSLQMLEAGATDLAFGTGIYGLGRLYSNVFRFAGRATGAHSPEVRQVIGEATEGGVGIGAIDLNKPFYNISSRVGGVIPVVGGPIRTAAEVKGAQLSEGLIGALNDVSPAIDLPRLGIKMVESAKKALSARRAVANAKYVRMHAAFDEIGNPAIISTNRIKERALSLIGDIDQLPRASKSGEPIGIPVSSDQSFMDALEKFLDLPDFITPRQLEALQKNLNRAARSRSGNSMSANEYRIITDINAATWDALDDVAQESVEALGRESGAVSEILATIRSAKRSWGDLKALEETAAASQFKRVDRNFFTAGFSKPGSVEVDELANLYLSAQSPLRSPQFIGDLEKLIGPENRKSLARTILTRAAAPQGGAAKIAQAVNPERMLFPGQQAGSGAMDIVVFDAAAMRNRLGLSAPEGLLGEGAARQNRQALARLLEGTNVTVSRLDSFLKTAARIQASPTGDPSVFLSRRLILSGTPKALIPGSQAAGFGATMLTGPISIGAFVISGRAFSRLISTPRGLQILREGLKPNLPRQQLHNLAIRIMRAAPGEQVSIQEEGGHQRPVPRAGFPGSLFPRVVNQ